MSINTDLFKTLSFRLWYEQDNVSSDNYTQTCENSEGPTFVNFIDKGWVEECDDDVSKPVERCYNRHCPTTISLRIEFRNGDIINGSRAEFKAEDEDCNTWEGEPVRIIFDGRDGR